MIVITCPKCKQVFEIATQPITGVVACPSCRKALRLRPKTPADALPPMERRPARSARRTLLMGLALLVMAVVVAVVYKLARPPTRRQAEPGGTTRPAAPTTMWGSPGPGTTRPTTKPIRRRSGAAPVGYQIGE
jgi:uncharacterized protein YbaR (Trm112 family)